MSKQKLKQLITKGTQKTMDSEDIKNLGSIMPKTFETQKKVHQENIQQVENLEKSLQE